MIGNEPYTSEETDMAEKKNVLEMLGYKSSDDFPIYISDEVRDSISNNVGIVTSITIHSDLAIEARVAYTHDTKGCMFSKQSGIHIIGNLQLSKKGDRPDLPVPKFGFEKVKDILSGNEILILSLGLFSGGCCNYLTTRLGVDDKGRRHETKTIEEHYLETI